MVNRVCILSSVHNTFDTRIFEKEARSLVNAGYEVEFYTPHEEPRVIHGVRIVDFPLPKNRVERIITGIQMIQEAAKKDFDIYHIQDPELLPMGVVLESIVDKPVIYDVHENYELSILSREWIPSRLQAPISSVFNAIEQPLSKQLSGVIAASKDIAQRFEDHSNVEVVTNYPPKEWAAKSPDREPTDKSQVVYVGSITEVRGVPAMIEAVSQLTDDYDIQFVLAGEYGNDEIQSKVDAYLEQYDWLEFQGWISMQEVMALLKESNVGGVCIHPDEQNLRYGAYRSNKLFQYMSAAIPVVGPNMGNWNEIVETNSCGILVDTTDPDQIATAIESLVNDPSEAEKMGENGREAIVEEYNWENQKEKLLNFYQQL